MTVVVAGSAVLAGACSAPAPEPVEETMPAAAASSGPRLYVSDETGTAVVVVDPVAGTVVERLNVGKRPRGLQVSPDGSQLLVALSGSPIAGPGVDEDSLPPADREADGIGIVDLATGQLLRKLDSGQDPESFDVSNDGRRIFVSNEETGEMTALDLDTGEIIGRVEIGEEPEGVTVRPDGQIVYVTCEGTHEVFAVDAQTLEIVARVETGDRPRSIAFLADGSLGFVTAENSSSVTVFDTATHEVVDTIVLPADDAAPMVPRPMGAVVAPSNNHLFVSLGRAASVAEIDVATRTVTRVIPGIGTRPWGIAVNTEGTQIFTANGPSGDVSVIDVATGSVTKIDVGGSPWGVAYHGAP